MFRRGSQSSILRIKYRCIRRSIECITSSRFRHQKSREGYQWKGQDSYIARYHSFYRGWIPFQRDELRFNDDREEQERVAICMLQRLHSCKFTFANGNLGPGTSPTSISTTQALLFAPLVYVDYKPQEPFQGIPVAWHDADYNRCSSLGSSAST